MTLTPDLEFGEITLMDKWPSIVLRNWSSVYQNYSLSKSTSETLAVDSNTLYSDLLMDNFSLQAIIQNSN